jgi:hypothetical protein
VQPTLGWTFLSQRSIRHAEAKLRADQEGVRDEIGFLFLHERFADRFFPGTSVQHTRLRYALFAPWIYQGISENARRGLRSVDEVVDACEVRLAGQLLLGGEKDKGTIGQEVYERRRPSSQPATMVYWSALGRWGILRRLPDGSTPSRRAAHRLLGTKSPRNTGTDDDGNPLEEPRALFTNLPDLPKNWGNAEEPLNFKLLPEEKVFLKKQLLTTRRGYSSELSLLARLASHPIGMESAVSPWNQAVMARADQADVAALEQARYAASLAAIGRGVYAALVEELRDERDGVATSRLHRENLSRVISENRKDALALNIRETVDMTDGVPEFLISVLSQTQTWLKREQSLNTLLELFSKVESDRKGSRAKLALTATGRQRRAEWNNEEHPKAKKLHYRWRIVRRMLQDLTQ